MRTPFLFRQGFTLIEVLVSFAIFAVLGTLVALSMRSYASAQLKGNVGTDIDRALTTTAGRLETLLRGCRILSPAVGSTSDILEFQAPEFDENGLLAVAANGIPFWLPPRQIAFSNGLLSVTGDQPIIVGTLGPKGEISFERSADQIVRVSLTAGFEAAEAVERQVGKLDLSLWMAP